ncbi:MAG: MT-A70 family methyltransferase [Chlamydiota bacterium]|nr:MT-A70 family methyltransferase [Chlamydiota bacterium]
MDYHSIANIFPMMQTSELQDLADDIKSNGLHNKIILYEGKILDGRNRLLACEIAGIVPDFGQYEGDEPLAYVISLNLKRRHLNESQRAVIASRLANMTKHLHKDDMQICISQPEAAEMLNVSTRMVASVKAIEKAAPDLIKEIESGNMTVNNATTVVKRAQNIERLESIEIKEAKALDGVYDVIVIDPPWPIEKIERDVAPNQVGLDYPTMSLDDIKYTLKIPHAEDCHIWIWTTQKYLPTTFEMIHHRRLKYVCTFVWHKPGGFQPFGLPQYNAEFVIYCRYGTPVFVETKAFPVCFNAKRGAHSEKPTEFYDMVRRVTAGRRLDMFNRKPIEGFDGYGLESPDNV